MRSVLEEEIRDRLSSLAFRIRQYDAGVVLAAALCFTPLPPATLVGLILSVSHLGLARSKLSSSETSLLVIGIIVASSCLLVWAIAVYWLSRSGQLQAIPGIAASWWSWFLQTIEPGFLRRSPAPPLLRHA